jgi:uncharacterized protein
MPKQSLKGVALAAQREDLKVRRAVAKDGAPSLSGVTTLDSFVNLSHKLGIGADSPLTTGSYGFNPITRNRTLLEWVHRGSWLGGVAVDLVADDMTRAGVEFLTELSPDASELIERSVAGLGVWNAINETVRWGRLYGGCLAVALVDGQDLRTPLRLETVGRGQFKGLLPLDRWMVTPALEDLVTDYGPHLGLPKFYRVEANAPALRNTAIHHSRVMFRHVGIELPYQQRLMENLWGISVLERLYDRMIAFDSASTGAAQLVYKAYLRTFSVDGLREVVAQGGKALDGLTAYVNTMRRFQGIEGMTMIDAKDKFEAQGHSAFSGLSDVLTQFGQQLSGALQIPLVRLFGQSPAGLSATGESDVRNYYDNIKQQQVKTMSHGVTTTYRLAAQSAGVELPPNFALDFRSLWQLSDKEKTDIASTTATAIGGAVDSGLFGRQTGLKELRQSSRRTGVFTNITQEMITLADDDVGPPPGAEGVLPPGFGEDPGMNKEGEHGELGSEKEAGQVGEGDRRRVRIQQQAPGGGPANRDDREGVGA